MDASFDHDSPLRELVPGRFTRVSVQTPAGEIEARGACPSLAATEVAVHDLEGVDSDLGFSFHMAGMECGKP